MLLPRPSPLPSSNLLIISKHTQAHVHVADIFATNPYTFYSIRPLEPVLGRCNQLGGLRQAEYLRRQFSCELVNQSQLFAEAGLSTNPAHHTPALRNCLLDNFCFRYFDWRCSSGLFYKLFVIDFTLRSRIFSPATRALRQHLPR